MDFTTMDIYTITTGTGSDGTRYLLHFMKEYTLLFKEKVNPGCAKCLNEYLMKYKKHFAAMENTCQYRLHAKYENIPLEFGSAILVNNGNITDEYAQKLLEQNNGQRYFAQMPEKKIILTGEISQLKKAARKARLTKKKEPAIEMLPQTEIENDDLETIDNL
jgi:hypothetical protein